MKKKDNKNNVVDILKEKKELDFCQNMIGPLGHFIGHLKRNKILWVLDLFHHMIG